jgi:hypothetical protein
MPFRLSIALVPGRVGQYLILVGSWNISDLTTRHETASLAGPSQVAFSVHSDRSKPDPDMKMIAEVARLDIEHSAASFALWPRLTALTVSKLPRARMATAAAPTRSFGA